MLCSLTCNVPDSVYIHVCMKNRARPAADWRVCGGQGGEAFSCEVCQERTTAVKRMRVHRLPRCLLLHIKRFRYNGLSREKLSATVTYPLKARTTPPPVRPGGLPAGCALLAFLLLACLLSLRQPAQH